MFLSAITYRIATGPNQGKKVFTLQTVPPTTAQERESECVAKVAGFSLHAAQEVQIQFPAGKAAVKLSIKERRYDPESATPPIRSPERQMNHQTPNKLNAGIAIFLVN